MKSSLRNTIVAGTVAAGLLGSGGIAFAQTSATAPTEQTATQGTSRTTDQASRQADRAAHDAARANDLATRLGLSAEQVTAAETAARATVDAQLGAPPARPTERPTTPPTDEQKAAMDGERTARHDAFQTAFADELGVSTDQLQAAREAGLVEHLAEEVAAGEITQEEADARLSALQTGEMGPHGPHGPGGLGGPRVPGEPT